ncbi:hypothetical protein J2848_005698 [Azospirillum lipoferum]|uniref:Phage tail protein n=1 Tax=Azospirillum lipoferum TaxID=193 RepID=A0A5A9GEX5_AZOLI|nr:MULTISPECIES: hypothetical protein [Azospirillum]KAA0592946.1 hypothetical protein FZ942_25825 [Azospirillum lipoferum]MCP1613997.1 hypothetical protein [Azospirillum lipoferum]MDW5537611.1 hypothetical protein [Azospirillum sp. NL1]
MAKAISTAKMKVFVDTSGTECDTITEYDALTWVKVGNLLDVGEFGAQYQEVTYTTIDEAIVHRLKGALDNGTFSLTVARNPDDAGQGDVLEGLDSYENVNVKVELNDKPAGVGAKPTRFCYPAKIFSYKNQFGDANQVVKAVINVGIDGFIIEGARGT